MDNLKSTKATFKIAFQSCIYAYSLIWALKKITKRSFAFPPMYRDLYRLFIATSKDHWVPKMLFILKIN